MFMQILSILGISTLGTLSIGFLLVLLRIRQVRKQKARHSKTIAFLHPSCNAGGGGERVLWASILAAQKSLPKANIIVYGGRDELDVDALVKRAEQTFGLQLLAPISLVGLWSSPLIKSVYYPRFTLLLQGIGMFVMGLECLFRHPVDMIIDTQGCPFAYPLFSLSKIPLICYTHYPFISAAHRHPNCSPLKIPYNKLLAWLYSICGHGITHCMVNSSWTKERMLEVWESAAARISLVYPPCDIEKLASPRLDPDGSRRPWIVSLSQFRPEKNHRLQIEALATLFAAQPTLRSTVRLIMIGGCRGPADLKRVAELRQLAAGLGVGDAIDFLVNISHSEILGYLRQASIGIHTMFEEHFGIGIVEFMAAGLICIANRSGGPQSDILTKSPELGFLCSTCEEYAHCMEHILKMSTANQHKIRQSARRWAVEKFSSINFEAPFQRLVKVSAIRRCA